MFCQPPAIGNSPLIQVLVVPPSGGSGARCIFRFTEVSNRRSPLKSGTTNTSRSSHTAAFRFPKFGVLPSGGSERSAVSPISLNHSKGSAAHRPTFTIRFSHGVSHTLTALIKHFNLFFGQSTAATHARLSLPVNSKPAHFLRKSCGVVRIILLRSLPL